MKAKSKSYVTSAKTMFAAMNILSKNGGTMPIRILMQEIEKTVELSAWEKETLENTGNIRWQSNMHFTSVDYVRAGYLIKKKGNWTITPEGEEALKLGAEKLRDEAWKRYKAWYRGKEQTTDEKPAVQPEEENDPAKETMIELETLEERAANAALKPKDLISTSNPWSSAMARSKSMSIPVSSPFWRNSNGAAS